MRLPTVSIAGLLWLTAIAAFNMAALVLIGRARSSKAWEAETLLVILPSANILAAGIYLLLRSSIFAARPGRSCSAFAGGTDRRCSHIDRQACLRSADVRLQVVGGKELVGGLARICRMDGEIHARPRGRDQDRVRRSCSRRPPDAGGDARWLDCAVAAWSPQRQDTPAIPVHRAGDGSAEVLVLLLGAGIWAARVRGRWAEWTGYDVTGRDERFWELEYNRALEELRELEQNPSKFGALAESGPYRQSLMDRAENPRRSLEWRVAQRTVYESTSRIIWLCFLPERPRYGE